LGILDVLEQQDTSTQGSRTYGVVIGVVADNQDPDGLGRVKLRFPWKDDADESTWARIATFMTGRDRGSWFLPEVDDEVLVAFEHGDVQHPVVLGSLWNGVDTPPENNSDGQNNIRKIKSRSGHELIFDDTSSAEKVTIKSQSGHSITLDDAPGSGKIIIETAGGHSLTFDDTAGSGKIELKTSAGVSATLTDVPPSLTVQDGSGNTTKLEPSGVTVNAAAKVTITASAVEITGGMVTVNAGMTTFSGVIQAQTVIASAGVVSPMYTPGAGNIW